MFGLRYDFQANGNLLLLLNMKILSDALNLVNKICITF